MRGSTILSVKNNIVSSIEQPLIHQSTVPTTKLEYLADWFTGKNRRRGEGSGGSPTAKEGSPTPNDISNENTCQYPVPTLTPQMSNSNPSGLLYLQSEYAVFTRSLAYCNIGELIRQPLGVDKNEWIANNIVSFFNHINALYGVLSELCTTSTCPTMIGPQNSLYYWIDEKGKKVKFPAPQYIDSAMTFIHKTLSNETIFPRRLDNKFPATFDVLVRKMSRLLFHCLAHIYAAHYRQLIDLELHPHLNSLFLHYISFLIKSDIIPSECSPVNTPSNSLTISGQIETRELRSELESLSVLYQLLAKQWQHTYAQASAQRRKTSNNQ